MALLSATLNIEEEGLVSQKILKNKPKLKKNKKKKKESVTSTDAGFPPLAELPLQVIKLKHEIVEDLPISTTFPSSFLPVSLRNLLPSPPRLIVFFFFYTMIARELIEGENFLRNVNGSAPSLGVLIYILLELHASMPRFKAPPPPLPTSTMIRFTIPSAARHLSPWFPKFPRTI